jgi:putative transposase
MIAIRDEFEAYGYRRVGAELPHRGLAAYPKEGSPSDARAWPAAKRRKRFVMTSDSDYDGPIFPDLTCNRMVDGPNI